MQREKVRRIWEGRVFVAVGLVLGGIMLALIFPITRQEVIAEENSTNSLITSNVNTNVSTLVRSSIAVALSSRVELNVVPRAEGAFAASVAEMRVNTNNTTGYAVYMQTTDNSSELKVANPHVEASIGPVDGTMTSGDYTTNLNQWGYAIALASDSINEMEYKAVPQAGDDAIVKTEGMSREDDYDLSFAVAVGSDLPAGLYTNQVLVSVVANPVEVRSLNDITYMQDMTAEICAITFEGESKQLVDSRDGKSYWVAKLADESCWMTQNLAITFGSGEGMVDKLSSMDSDLTAGREWKPAATVTMSINDVTGNNDVNGIESWNVTDTAEGSQWYYQFNTATAGMGQNTLGEGEVVSDSICPKGWKLPLGGTMNNGKEGSFNKLLEAYGVPTNNGDRLTEEPLNFVKAGIVSTGDRMDYVGWAGLYWSGVSSTTLSQTFILDFNGELVDPSSLYYGRQHGLAVRCVVR